MQKGKALIAARLSNLARVVADGSLTVLFKERHRPAVLRQHELHQHSVARRTPRATFNAFRRQPFTPPCELPAIRGLGNFSPLRDPAQDSPAQNPCQGQKPQTPPPKILVKAKNP